MNLMENRERVKVAMANYYEWVSVILVTIEIKTGTRRLMEFLLAPLMRGVSEGARER